MMQTYTALVFILGWLLLALYVRTQRTALGDEQPQKQWSFLLLSLAFVFILMQLGSFFQNTSFLGLEIQFYLIVIGYLCFLVAAHQKSLLEKRFYRYLASQAALLLDACNCISISNIKAKKTLIYDVIFYALVFGLILLWLIGVSLVSGLVPVSELQGMLTAQDMSAIMPYLTGVYVVFGVVVIGLFIVLLASLVAYVFLQNKIWELLHQHYIDAQVAAQNKLKAHAAHAQKKAQGVYLLTAKATVMHCILFFVMAIPLALIALIIGLLSSAGMLATFAGVINVLVMFALLVILLTVHMMYVAQNSFVYTKSVIASLGEAVTGGIGKLHRFLVPYVLFCSLSYALTLIITQLAFITNLFVFLLPVVWLLLAVIFKLMFVQIIIDIRHAYHQRKKED